MFVMDVRRIACGAVWLTLLAGAAARGETLEGRLRGILGSEQLKGAGTGVDVVEVTEKGAVGLFSYNATTPLGPASNCKLLTTAAAFEKYGAKATFKTVLYQVGEDLVLVGGGDPALGDAKLTKDGRVTGVFEQWADALKRAGLTQYRDLVVDDRVFDRQWTHPNWPEHDRLDWFSAPVGGLNFNANCLDWIPRVGARGVEVELIPNTRYISVVNKATRGGQTLVSMIRPAESNRFELRGTVSPATQIAAKDAYNVPIYDPGMWTGTILRDVLANGGVNGTGQVRRVGDGEKMGQGRIVASAETPLVSVIKRANTNSMNMMAEGLCKRLGHDATGKPGSWENGTAAVEGYLKGIGVSPEWVSMDDGSGLSNKNKVAAKAFTTVLARMAGRADGELFVETLAVPQEDGTLIRRFKGMRVSDAVHAKTGHIAGVSALSGYIDVETNGNKRRFAFSILCNKYQGNVNPLQDQMCEAIYIWAGGK